MGRSSDPHYIVADGAFVLYREHQDDLYHIVTEHQIPQTLDGYTPKDLGRLKVYRVVLDEDKTKEVQSWLVSQTPQAFNSRTVKTFS